MAHQHPIEKVKIELQSKFSRLEAEFARLRERVEGPENANLGFLVSQLRLERERANSAQEELGLQRERANSAEESLKSAEKELGLQRERANSAEEELGLQRERANSAEEDLGLQRERANSAEEELGLQRERANSAEEELGLQRERANSAEEDLGLQRERANSAEEELSLQRERANSAEEELGLQRERANSAEEQLGLERDRVQSLEEKLRSSEHALAASVAKVGQLEKKLTSAKEKLAANPVNQRDGLGRTQLYWAAEDGDEVKVQRLLSQGADVNIVDNYEGWTPLHVAAQMGRVNVCVSLLHSDKTCLDARDKRKRTPFHLASDWGHLQVVRLLVERGADTTATDDEGKSAWDLACTGGRREHEDEIRRLLR